MILLVCSVESGMGAFSMNGRFRHVACATTPRCRCTSRRRDDETRIRRVGEPNSVAATGSWRQGKPRITSCGDSSETPASQRLKWCVPEPARTKKRPGPAGAFKSATKALRASDYLPLEAGAEDSAILA